MTEVAIVGSGINGLMTAYHLRECGFRVVVYDQGPIPNPNSASYGEHRLLHPWSSSADPLTAKRALKVLGMWQDTFQKINFNGFEQTGVFALTSHDSYKGIDQTLISKKISACEVANISPLFSCENEKEGVLFPQFGILFASRILQALTVYLKHKEVRLISETPIKAIDFEQTKLVFRCKQTKKFDCLVLCAGTGAESIIRDSIVQLPHISASHFKRQRCFVLYGTHPGFDLRNANTPAWASLGQGDLWGMPPSRGILLKLGCGDLTHNPEQQSPELKNQTIRRILNHYHRACQNLESFLPINLGFNHWTKINSENAFHQIGNCIVVTSDNGTGFKFGPLLGKEVASIITAML